MFFFRGVSTCWFTVAMLLGIWILVSLPNAIMAQNAASSLLELAEERYRSEKYQETLDILEPIQDLATLSDGLAIKIHVLRGRCHLELGQADLARESFFAAHLLRSAGQSDTSDTEFSDTEVAEFQSDATTSEDEGGGILKWIIGGVGAAAAAAVLLLGSDSESEEDPVSDVLPGLPSVPDTK